MKVGKLRIGERMLAAGDLFGFQMPVGWTREDDAGLVICAAPPSDLGFSPTLVLRESRLESSAPTALASLSSANISAVYEQVHGSHVVRVQALPDPYALAAERRRLWILTSAVVRGDRVLTLLTMQDLVTIDSAVAELTATMALIDAEMQPVLQEALDSLSPLPPERRRVPSTTSSPGPTEFDEWATARDGKPRELIPSPGTTAFPLESEGLISQHSFNKIASLNQSSQAMRRLHFHASSELTRAGIMADHEYTPFGQRVLHTLINGNHWECRRMLGVAASFKAWSAGNDTLVAQSGGALPEGMCRFGFCESNDVARHLLRWSGVQASWDVSFEATTTLPELERKTSELSDVPVFDTGEAKEFSEQPWNFYVLEDDTTAQAISWVATAQRGVAFAHHLPHNRVRLTQTPDLPMWELIGGSALSLSTGSGFEGVEP